MPLNIFLISLNGNFSRENKFSVWNKYYNKLFLKADCHGINLYVFAENKI